MNQCKPDFEVLQYTVRCFQALVVFLLYHRMYDTSLDKYQKYGLNVWLHHLKINIIDFVMAITVPSLNDIKLRVIRY